MGVSLGEEGRVVAKTVPSDGRFGDAATGYPFEGVEGAVQAKGYHRSELCLAILHAFHIAQQQGEVVGVAFLLPCIASGENPRRTVEGIDL